MLHSPNKIQYILNVLRSDPFEFSRLFFVACTTFYAQFIKRCVGPGCTVESGVRFVNPANIRVGRDSLLKENVYLRAGAMGYIRCGERIAFNSFTSIYGHGGVEIGDDTQLGPGCTVTTTGHDYREGLETSFSKIVIGNRVWVGARAIILPGVTIGDNAVIGAGAVVTKDIPPDCVAVGVPARVIKQINRDADRHAAAQEAVEEQRKDAASVQETTN